MNVIKTEYRMWLRLTSWLLLFASPLMAQQQDPYKSKPAGHDKNKQAAKSAYEANLKKYAADTNMLVLPGLLADRQKQRVEVMVESTKLGQGASCEFTIIGEDSQHGYEAVLISFAKPSAVHQALKFIGVTPGEPADPTAFRRWARGDSVVLNLLSEKEPPFRLERLLKDRRTDPRPVQDGFFISTPRGSAP